MNSLRRPYRSVSADADELLGGVLLLCVGRRQRGLPEVSEIFPMETRAMAIALFYACGTAVAIAAPWTFGKLIETDSVGLVTFVIGGTIMANGGVVEILLGVEAAGKSLEAVARPINAVRRSGRTASPIPARAR